VTAHLDTHALKAIESLQRPGKPDLLNRIVDLFRSESPKTIASLQDGMESSDLQAVRNAAHTLKSSSAYVGAKALSERCRDLESAAREGNFPACIALGDDIADLFEASVAELDRYMVNHVSKAA
jgi:HPt (histidine-containing phosphotransfer) domain-containing protein